MTKITKYSRKSKHHDIIVWDWRDQPDWPAINAALKNATVKRIIEVPNTGSDVFAVVVGARTEKEAQAEWDAEEEEEEEEAL